MEVREEESPPGLMEKPVVMHALKRGGRQEVLLQQGTHKLRVRVTANSLKIKTQNTCTGTGNSRIHTRT